MKFNYNLKFIFSVRLFQILRSELIKMTWKDKEKQTYFDKTWLEHQDFSQWVAEVKNEPTKYKCKVCHKANGLSNMGIGALKIHLKGPSHEANAKNLVMIRCYLVLYIYLAARW